MISSGLTAETELRASGQVALVDWINISNDGSAAGTPGQIIIENGAGDDELIIPFESTQHQSLFVSLPDPFRVESGLIINFVTVTKAIVDVGWR